MKTIGQIRRERLQQLTRAGLSFAELNSLLGRNRRDATLNQIAKAAPNSTTGKPREMGSTQARQIEAALRLPDGWFDTSPEGDNGKVELKVEGGKYVVLHASHTEWVALERAAKFNARPEWPFQSVRQEDISNLSAANLATLERLVLAFLGKPAPAPDWRTAALRIAAQLDHEHRSDTFTTFVRALEVELNAGNVTAEVATQ